MVLPKLIYKELYLIGLQLSTYKLSIPEVLRNIMKTNPNAFHEVYMSWENTKY